jgi:hypothetical protein
MLDTPQVIQTDERLTAVIHLTISRAEISHVMGPAINEVISTLIAQGIKPAPVRAFLSIGKGHSTFLISRWVSRLIHQSHPPAA